jgi:hypothetical protein
LRTRLAEEAEALNATVAWRATEAEPIRNTLSAYARIKRSGNWLATSNKRG